MPKGKCRYHPSLKKLLFIANRGYHRKLEINTIQRAKDSGRPDQIVTSTSQSLHVWHSENGWKNYKSQNTKKSTVK